MINLAQLNSLIKAQEERLKRLRSILELAKEAHDTAESLAIEFTILAIGRSTEKESCTAPAGSRRRHRIESAVQRAENLAADARQNHLEVQQVYNEHLKKYGQEEAELRRLKMEYEKIIVRTTFSSNWFSEIAANNNPEPKLEIAKEDFLENRFPLPNGP